MSWAFASLNASPGARALYDEQRAKGLEHNDALRRLANRLVGILHGCLKTRTLYDEATAWSHRRSPLSRPRMTSTMCRESRTVPDTILARGPCRGH